MSINYPLGDFLIRIKNAGMAGRKTVVAPHTKYLHETAKALIRAGYLMDAKKEDRNLVVNLSFHKKAPLLTNLTIISKPGNRRYMGMDEISVWHGPALLLLSTPKGILTGDEAKKKGVGERTSSRSSLKNHMSKIGKLPIKLPNGVSVEINGIKVTVKGPKGTLEKTFTNLVEIKLTDDVLTVKPKKETKLAKSLYGTTRALLANMVTGVSEGWSKVLELVGTGYRAETNGKTLTLQIGYSHPVKFEAPETIIFKVEKSDITVEGIDKEMVTQLAALIRGARPPEPYQGKGIKYKGEKIRRKAGKAAKAAAK